MASRANSRSGSSAVSAGGELRLPPHSIEAEQSLLGGLLLKDDVDPYAAECPMK